MTAAAFFGVMSAVALAAIFTEYIYGHRHGKDWHDPMDTLANLNLGASNVVVGSVTAAAILGVYAALFAVRPVSLGLWLPRPAHLLVGFLLAEFLQYWNHRASHAWNLLWWGHVTHHSSSKLNLSTGPRVNWFYRATSAVFYVPLPLLGFTVEEFLLFQTAMNVYNLFMHTRFNLPFGPLGLVLVTPMSHRLHHSADPGRFGNYGASLIVFDRLFGTYAEPDDRPLVFGVDRNVDCADPLRLNFAYLSQLAETARSRGNSFVAELLAAPRQRENPSPVPWTATQVPTGYWLGAFLVIGTCVSISQLYSKVPAVPGLAIAVLGVTLCAALGWSLDRRRI
jgi:alkylglycerol monooxygenase